MQSKIEMGIIENVSKSFNKIIDEFEKVLRGCLGRGNYLAN